MNRFTEKLRRARHMAATHGGGVLAAVGCFLLAFLLGCHLFFPTTAVKEWLLTAIEARTPFRVQIETFSLAPVFTLRGSHALVTVDGGPAPPITLDKVRLRPLWTTLPTGNPGLSIEAELLQGQLAAAWRRDGDFAVRVAGVTLREVPVSQANSALLSGTVVKGEIQRDSPAKKKNETQLALEMDNSTLTMMGQTLNLGKIVIAGNGPGNSLRLATVTASGGDVAVTGSGSLLLGASAAASRISLDLNLRPASSAPSGLAALLQLTTRRQADGSYRLRLNGSPGQLSVASAAAAVGQRPAPVDDE